MKIKTKMFRLISSILSWALVADAVGMTRQEVRHGGWRMGAWSPCSAHRECEQGVMTREVQCIQGEGKCHGHLKPQTQTACMTRAPRCRRIDPEFVHMVQTGQWPAMQTKEKTEHDANKGEQPQHPMTPVPWWFTAGGPRTPAGFPRVNKMRVLMKRGGSFAQQRQRMKRHMLFRPNAGQNFNNRRLGLREARKRKFNRAQLMKKRRQRRREIHRGQNAARLARVRAGLEKLKQGQGASAGHPPLAMHLQMMKTALEHPDRGPRPDRQMTAAEIKERVEASIPMYKKACVVSLISKRGADVRQIQKEQEMYGGPFATDSSGGYGSAREEQGEWYDYADPGVEEYDPYESEYDEWEKHGDETEQAVLNDDL